AFACCNGGYPVLNRRKTKEDDPDQARIISLKAKLASTSKGNKSIAEFLNEIRSIANELALTQNPISEEDLEKDLASLPVIPTINATHRQNSKAPQFHKSFQAYNFNNRKSRGGYGNHSYGPWKSQNGNRSYRADLSCQFYEIAGHATSDSRKLSRFLRENNITVVNSEQTNAQQLPVANDTIVSLAVHNHGYLIVEHPIMPHPTYQPCKHMQTTEDQTRYSWVTFLGVEVISTTSSLFLSQHRHIADLLSRFKMSGAKEVATPLNSTETLSLTDGSLNLSQFMHAPTHLHLQALKRVLRYLKGTIHHELFLKRASPLTVTTSSDSDWGEYKALANAAAKIIWVQDLLHELGNSLGQPPTLFCDNTGATYLCANPVYHSRMKHLALDYHFVRERVTTRSLHVLRINSKDQLADMSTKPLGRGSFIHFRSKIRVSDGSFIIRGVLRINTKSSLNSRIL
nr:hypothetical protein [Tanacetum cinerariifolium]